MHNAIAYTFPAVVLGGSAAWLIASLMDYVAAAMTAANL